RRVRAPSQRQHHLVSRRDEGVANHLERDWVQRHARLPAPHTDEKVRPSENRAPDSEEMSTGGACPAIVAASDSPIAGPILNPCPLPPKQEYQPPSSSSPTIG